MSDLIRRSDAVKAIASQLAFNAEMKTAEEFSWEDFEGSAEWILEKCETVDAVPVVRCKDCTYWEDFGETWGRCEATGAGAHEDGYCSDGERKAEE